jgi:glycosyltransferase involved in cell wall biosynthesis
VSGTPALRPRVLIVGHGPPTVGGIPSYVTRLAEDRRLRSAVEVGFLNTAPSFEKRPGRFTGSNLRLVVEHGYRIYRLARGADVVHLNLAPAPALPLARALALAVAARLGGARVILQAHTGRIRSAADSLLYRLLLRLSRAVVDVFVVVSEEGRVGLGRVGLDAVVLANGVDTTVFGDRPRRDGDGAIAFVGTVCERKGLLDLRDALLSLRREGGPPARLVVVGDGRQEGPGAFERIRAAFAVAGLDRVEFTGPVSEARVRDILAESAIFCLPSHWEACPLTVLEAMAAGTAVVATRVGDIPVMLDEGRAGILVQPNDAGALASAVRSLLEDPTLRRRLAEAGKRRVEERYGWTRMVDRLVAVYEDLASRTSGRPRSTRADGPPGEPWASARGTASSGEAPGTSAPSSAGEHPARSPGRGPPGGWHRA